MSIKTDKWIDDHKQELIEWTRGICRIPSVQGEPVEANPAGSVPPSPFGVKVREAEDLMIKVAKDECGFDPVDGNGYYAYVDAGEEEGKTKEMLGIICHLEVVPEGTGWDYPA